MKTRLLSRILVILGFGGALGACAKMYGPAPMYGVPGKWFSARGEVTDEAGNPIAGIKVSLGNGEERNILTNAEGVYRISGNVYGNTALIEFDDIDGAENGGDFAATAISVDVDANDVPVVVMTLKESSDE